MEQDSAVTLRHRRLDWSSVALALLIFVAIGRILLTYGVFTQVYDEPYHLVCGMRWFNGDFGNCTEHPPLARVAAASAPYLVGLRLTGGFTGAPSQDKATILEGNAILNQGENYTRNLTLARLGILPFFILASAAVWLWAKSLFGVLPALFAAILFTFLPPVLAHSGIATTDMAVTALLFCVLYTFTRWLLQPDLSKSIFFGVTLGLAVLSKFSTLVFLPACILSLLASLWLLKRPNLKSATRECRRRFVPVMISLTLASLVVWAGYRFSFTPLLRPEDRPHGVVRSAGIDRLLNEKSQLRNFIYNVIEAPIPAKPLLDGVAMVWRHNTEGHTAYLLGENRRNGWWYFFIVVLAVKTPLAFLLLVAIGTSVILRNWNRENSWRQSAPILCAMSILLVSSMSTINLGVRHILPIYPLLALVAGYGAASLFVARSRNLLVSLGLALLLLWHSLSSALAHPDYLAYFNELAGSAPEKILVESDLDWGQDLDRLAQEVRRRGIEQLTLHYFGTADPNQHGLRNARELNPYSRTAGWIAISESGLKIDGYDIAQQMGQSIRAFDWLEAYEPVARAGKSIRIYHIPERSPPLE